MYIYISISDNPSFFQHDNMHKYTYIIALNLFALTQISIVNMEKKLRDEIKYNEIKHIVLAALN